MEGEQIFFAAQNLVSEESKPNKATLDEAAKKFKTFIKEWVVDNSYIYRYTHHQRAAHIEHLQRRVHSHHQSRRPHQLRQQALHATH